jgi:hypothetical protein
MAIENDDDYEDVLPVPLDPASIEWLAMLERTTGKPARLLVATMIREIRTDDEAAHQVH